jgi:uncharacterized membrane protein YfcA
MNFLVAVLTGMGIGSGGLYIIYLTMIRNVDQISAQGLNLLFFITASLAAATVNVVKKRISWLSVLFLSTAGVAGAFLGTFIASRISERLLSIMFGVLFAVVGGVGFFTFAKKSRKD